MLIQYLEVHIKKEQVVPIILYNNNYMLIIMMEKLVLQVLILKIIDIIQYFQKIIVNVKKLKII